MKRLAVCITALCLAGGVHAEEVALIDACIGPVGQPDEHAVWCKGIVAEPCFYRKDDRSKRLKVLKSVLTEVKLIALLVNKTNLFSEIVLIEFEKYYLFQCQGNIDNS